MSDNERERIWLRVGDQADYISYDNLEIAITIMVVHGVICNGQPGEITRAKSGFQCSGRLGGKFAVNPQPQLRGQNYVSCYWGDGDAEMIRNLTDHEFAQICKANDPGGYDAPTVELTKAGT